MTLKVEKTFTHKGETYTVKSERDSNGARVRVFDSKGRQANPISYSVNIDTMMAMANDGFAPMPIQELVNIAESDVKRLL